MSKKSVEEKPSETAFFAALRRTLANKEYKNEKHGPDYLAEYFLPPHFRFFLRFKKKMGSSLPLTFVLKTGNGILCLGH
jgi:hypothetical protein